jgi:hypothetical protein
MFYEKGRRLGELNEKNQEKSPRKVKLFLNLEERGTFTEYHKL